MESILSKVVAIGSVILLLAVSEAAGAQRRQVDAEHAGQPRKQPQISLSADLVELLVKVVDSKGQPVRGLTQSNFEVLDDGTKQGISHFSDQNGPLSLGIVFDTTGMAPEAVEGILGALRKSRLVGEKAAEVSFVALNERAWVAMGFVATADQVLPELRFADPHGAQSLREAFACVQAGLRSPQGSRTVVLLITDGGTGVGPRGIDNFVEGGQAQLYAVFPVVPGAYRGRVAEETASAYPSWQWWWRYSFETTERNLSRAAVARVAEGSGGRALYAFAESEQSRIELFDRIGDEAGGQYAIGF